MLDWLYRHYFLTSSIVLYYMVLFGFGTYQLFSDIQLITGDAVSAYGILSALPPTAVALFKWRFK